MAYTLRGKIAKEHPYQLDPTLSVYGAGAEAEATGKAIAAANKNTEDHKAREDNPHKVSKEQVGLGNVDNTADSEKPVSTLQAEAIAEAKKAGTDAQIAAENAQTAAGNAQTTADEAKTAAGNAQTTADEAKTAADNALNNSKAYADSLTFHKNFTLPASGWSSDAPYTQTVSVEGIIADDDPHVYPMYSDEVETAMEQKEAMAMVSRGKTADGSITFVCFEDKPAIDIPVKIEVNR